jgi:hypothetical protein
MTDTPADVRCSFCGKGRDDVRTVIAAPGAAICDECVDACVEVLIRQGYGRRHFSRWWRRIWGHSGTTQ